jgi:hypothetical protein
VLLLSRPRPEGIAVLLVLPPGTTLQMHYLDDGTTRDITGLVVDLICEYLVRTSVGAPNSTGEDEEGTTGAQAGAGTALTKNGGDDAPTESIGTLRIVGDSVSIRLALLDATSGTLEEIPSARLLPLLGAAVSMTVADALAEIGDQHGGGGEDGSLPKTPPSSPSGS